ncbi:hypothetical protein LSH36_780g02047 [Paralvinella palmiformis]|uniref:EML-like first beta-propeller domain-containing protein n=1 Tax=Paralvinella palmiformis TaxID=53620 RepID=A0AAD9J031_9ANNE|nr:hypothetical protein LSH36_780g02047 [Paralvinella palmiformis]
MGRASAKSNEAKSKMKHPSDMPTPSQSASQSASQPATQLVYQGAKQPARPPNSQPVQYTVSVPAKQPVNQSVNQPNSQSVNQTVIQAVSQPNSQTVNQTFIQTVIQTVSHRAVRLRVLTNLLLLLVLKFLRAKYIICLLHNEKGDLVTGDSNGTVYVWGNGGSVITNFIKHGHDGPVFSLLFVRGTLITGGRDGMVYGWTWNKNMDQTGKIQIPKPEGGVRMLQNHKDRLLIGTTTNSILTAALSATALRNPLAGIELDKTALTMGHFGDIYGLCASDDPEFTSLVFTAGHDGVLCLYDTDKRQPLWKFFLKGTKISCIDANTAEGFIAIGTKDSLILLSIEKDEDSQVFLSEICRHKVVKNKLTTIKLAPDCESFAAADIAGALYIIGLRDARPDEEGQEEVWDLSRVIQAHNGPILGMDWSYDIWANTYLLRTSSGSYEVFICVWFSKQAEEGQITSLDVNLKKTLLAMGDSQGYLSLFRYPCSKKGAYSHSYHLHEHLHWLVFNKNGSRVLTIGGTDSSVTQWLVQ